MSNPTRKLIDNREVEEVDLTVTISIKSRCLDKWRFVGLETGEVWRRNTMCYHSFHFMAANEQDLKALQMLLDSKSVTNTTPLYWL